MFSTEQHFVINGERKEDLEKVLDLAIKMSGYKSVESFYKDKKGLVLCWTTRDNTTQYPFEATIPVLSEQIMQYITSLSDDEILKLAGPCPSIDGCVRLGWEVFHPLWYGENGLEEYDWAALLAVRPSWIIYAK
jgi:hypothetical protein